MLFFFWLFGLFLHLMDISNIEMKFPWLETEVKSFTEYTEDADK